MRLQHIRNLFQDCVIWQEMQKGYHQSRPKRTMTNMLSAVFCSDLALSEKSIRQRERFCLEILREIQHSATENKDKMTWGVGADRCPFSMGCVQQSWTTLAGASPVTVIASEPCS